MPRAQRQGKDGYRTFAAPIAVALAIKATALVVIYFAFFVPAPPPTAAHTATVVLGLPQ